jgi:hypothetical protein
MGVNRFEGVTDLDALRRVSTELTRKAMDCPLPRAVEVAITGRTETLLQEGGALAVRSSAKGEGENGLAPTNTSACSTFRRTKPLTSRQRQESRFEALNAVAMICRQALRLTQDLGDRWNLMAARSPSAAIARRKQRLSSAWPRRFPVSPG